jgi:putative sigma-54 modulation protein
VRYKGKRVDRRQGQLGNKQNLNNEQDEMPALEPEIFAALVEEQERKIVRTKRFLVSPMTEDEAIEQMELLGHSFFIFYNVNVERINVLYQRGDNNYGLLDPELA